MRRFLPFPPGIALTALFALAASSPSFAQQPAAVSGVVTNAAGQPLAGASVFSGTGSQQIATITGVDGRFQIATSTNVLHAGLDGYEPLTLLIKPPAGDLRLELLPLTGTLLAPACGPPPTDHDVVRLGTPGLGLEFTVSRKGWTLHDLGQGDLHEYVVAQKHSRAQLILWFGANAVSPTPEDHYFLESSSFAQHVLVAADPGAAGPPHAIGIDSSGTFSDGSLWRHLATPASGATYDHATPADAALFDAIISTLCVSPAS